VTANAWAREVAEDPLKASYRVWSTPERGRQGRIAGRPPERRNASPRRPAAAPDGAAGYIRWGRDHVERAPVVPGRVCVLVVEAGRGRFRVLTNGLQVVEDTIQTVIGLQAASLLHAFGPPPNPPLRRG